MNANAIAAGLAALAGGAYLYDVVWLPRRHAERARRIANAKGKPLLNVGAGTARSSLSALLFGPFLPGDVNLDISAPPGDPAPDRVTYGDVMDLPYADKTFGCVFASHLLEHVSDPERAFAEMRRVGDAVIAIVPKWWCPHTWLYPDHRWFIAQDGSLTPLW